MSACVCVYALQCIKLEWYALEGILVENQGTVEPANFTAFSEIWFFYCYVKDLLPLIEFSMEVCYVHINKSWVRLAYDGWKSSSSFSLCNPEITHREKSWWINLKKCEIQITVKVIHEQFFLCSLNHFADIFWYRQLAKVSNYRLIQSVFSLNKKLVAKLATIIIWNVTPIPNFNGLNIGLYQIERKHFDVERSYPNLESCGWRIDTLNVSNLEHIFYL